MTADDYCREVEAYLCRRNQGHLVRIVGPAFERVCAWAEQGVPLKVALRGIDRYCDRYYAAGPRRRPARIEFCEADVLDVFDEWRRAVGVAGWTAGQPADAEGGNGAARGRRRSSLAAHIDRAIVRLSSACANPELPAALHAGLEEILAALDALREPARRARGGERAGLISRLDELDDRMLAAARACADPALLTELGREAEAQLEPFLGRMPADEFARASGLAVDRLLVERWQLPRLRFEL